MPLIQGPQEHLSFVDSQIGPESIVSARALITAELPPDAASTLHPSLPSHRDAQFSELLTQEHEKLAKGFDRPPAIDLSRYEEPSAPEDPSDLTAWRNALQRAYASSEYLSSRLTNLSLLETYGRNAWLISNSQLEDILRDLEKDVAERKRELEEVERERRGKQDDVKGELEGLEEAWRTTVGRCIEVQAASEGLRREILERKRKAVAT